MSNKFRIGKSIEANGTSLKGHTKQTLAKLISRLGEPRWYNEEEADGKVTCEWIIVGEDGTVATVYDWKMGETPLEMYDWHIGGHNIKAVELVNSILK